ncbi:unannotated protein [freshwater metagenome]|uniref:Unannotated protein n=1 Tax=freshwater metagenome TaxID=449393 RepID=A0A6J6B6L9_9ZZZZ
MVHELGFDVEGGGVGLAAFLTLVELVLLFLEIRVRERQLHAVVLDRRNLFEDFFESRLGIRTIGPDQPRKAFGLKSEEVRNGESVGHLGKRHSVRVASGPLDFLLNSHRYFLYGRGPWYSV